MFYRFRRVDLSAMEVHKRCVSLSWTLGAVLLTSNNRCVVHGAGLTPEDLDKPQVCGVVVEVPFALSSTVPDRLASAQSGGRVIRATITW